MPEAAKRTVYLGLGANLGDRRANLLFGLRFLHQRGVEPARASTLYETQPVGPARQPDFLNQVVEGRTGLGPAAVLRAALDAEACLGRDRGTDDPPGGPRALDIDLLLDGDLILGGREGEEGLRLPHPRFHERRFVLVPFAEIAPEARHPVLGRTIAELLASCADPAWVRRA